MTSREITVSVSHMSDADPANLPSAELYVFSSPGRFGKPKRNASKFLRKGADDITRPGPLHRSALA